MPNMRQFASVPSPLAAQPLLVASAGAVPRGTSLDPTATMKHVPHESSGTEHAFVLPASANDDPPALYLALGPDPRPINIADLSQCDSLFDELQQTASDLGSWLSIIQEGLDDVLSLDVYLDAELQEHSIGSHVPAESPRAVL